MALSDFADSIMAIIHTLPHAPWKIIKYDGSSLSRWLGKLYRYFSLVWKTAKQSPDLEPWIHVGHILYILKMPQPFLTCPYGVKFSTNADFSQGPNVGA